MFNPFIWNVKLDNKDAQKKNEIEATLWYRKMSLVALNNFEWQNLPKGIKPRYIERCLFYNGACVLAKTDEYGYVALPATYSGDLDLYYEPTKLNILGNGYYRNVKLGDNAILIRNNEFMTPSVIDTLWYAEKITNIDRTIDVNLNLNKLPWIAKGNTNKLNTLKKIYEQVERNEPAIYIDDNIDSKQFTVFNTNVPFIIDKLNAYKKEIISEYFEMWGYPTTQVEKNERLTMTESEVKVEFSDSGYIGTMLEYRKQACDEAKDVFGLDMNVKIRRYRQKSDEYYELEKMKLAQQGIITNEGDDNNDEG